jgi:predicted permease
LVLLESLLLSAAGTLLGLAVGRFGAGALARMIPSDTLGIRFDGSLDWRVVGFAGALTLLTALGFGLIPALQTTRGASAATLKNDAAAVSLGRSQTRTRQVLIVAQAALSLMLLAVAGLFAKSLSTMFQANSGFAVDRLLVFSINPSEQRYDAMRVRELANNLQRRLEQLPGVESASGGATPILSGFGVQNTVALEGYQPKKGEDMQAGANYVLPGFFSTVGVKLLAGRDFDERDVADSPPVVIVNAALANRFFGSAAEAIGRHTGFGLGRVLPFEVIGVVADHKGKDMREDGWPRTYWPLMQHQNPDHIAFYLRTESEPKGLLPGVLGVVREIDPELAVFHAKTVERQLEETHFIERLFARLSATFALLATLIAAIGLYGIAAFSVARRTREIGVRIALGAQRNGVFKMVMHEALALALLGALIGLPLALGVGKLVEAQLYGVPAIDPIVTAGASMALLAASALAGYLPARRAMRISPVQALRHD